MAEIEIFSYVSHHELMDKLSDDELMDEIKERNLAGNFMNRRDAYEWFCEDVRKAFLSNDAAHLEIVFARHQP